MGTGVKAVGGETSILSPLGEAGRHGADRAPQTETGAEAPERRLPGTATKEEVAEAVSKLNRAAEIFGVDLKFSFREDSKRMQVEVLEASTGRVLKKIPPDEILDLVSKMNKMIGLLIDEKR
jgi:flagellar protein FlaG